MQGFIKLHRELMEKPIWLNSTPEQKVVLITLMMMANHKEKTWEFEGQTYKAEPGEFVTSIESIVEKSGKGVSVQNVRTALKRFEKLGFLTNKSTNKNRLISIVNWEVYQVSKDDLTSKLTDAQQATNKQLTTNKNVKNEENVKKKDIDKKIRFAENVHMTQKQYDDLVAQYGKQVVDSKIEDMEIYKASKGKTYKNDGIALKGWLKKDNKLPQKQTPVTYQTDDSLFNPNLGED